MVIHYEEALYQVYVLMIQNMNRTSGGLLSGCRGMRSTERLLPVAVGYLT